MNLNERAPEAGPSPYAQIPVLFISINALLGLSYFAALGLVAAKEYEAGPQIAYLCGMVGTVALLTALVSSVLVFQSSSRLASAKLLLTCSYAFGAMALCLSVTSAYWHWGWTALVVGFLLLGVGTIPIALLANLFAGDWGNICVLVALLAFAAGLRFLAFWGLGGASAEAETRAPPKL